MGFSIPKIGPQVAYESAGTIAFSSGESAGTVAFSSGESAGTVASSSPSSGSGCSFSVVA